MPIFYIFLRENAFLPLALLTTAVLVSPSISVAETSLETDTKKIEEREDKKKRPTSHQPEYVTVNSHMTADGTTGNPVGAGLMPKQTIAKSQRWSPFFGQGDKLSSGLNEDGFYGQG
ncbi:hypothetical protein ACJROZ_05380, partial [Acetobacter indonesiensis]